MAFEWMGSDRIEACLSRWWQRRRLAAAVLEIAGDVTSSPPGRGELRTWVDDAALICDVRDD
jgi:hypothetical protein